VSATVARVVARLAAVLALAPAVASGRCGEVVTVAVHADTTIRYTLQPAAGGGETPAVTLALFAGGSGHVDLDADGCPRGLRGNSLVRSIPLFNSAGFVTALVDARSDHHGPDGLGGHRIHPDHAADLGRVIADLRARTRGAVWLVGTSRGTISVVNAAARLAGPLAPDGIVLTSAVTVGTQAGWVAWTAQTVFDLPLQDIRMPVLIVGHADDTCLRSPASQMERIVARTNGVREQVVTLTGGPGGAGLSAAQACQGRSPHGFLGHEEAVVEGIARFVRGGVW